MDPCQPLRDVNRALTNKIQKSHAFVLKWPWMFPVLAFRQDK